MNLVKIDSFSIDKIKRRVVKFLRLGKSDVQTSFEVAPAGIDAGPSKGKIGLWAQTGDKGKTVFLGVLNTNQKAEAGELRLFSVDANGTEKTYLWLKKDGNIEVFGSDDHMVRYSKLEQAFNELKSDFNTFVNTYNGHTHPGVQSGGSSTSTTPASGTTSSADISPAKITHIKTKATD